MLIMTVCHFCNVQFFCFKPFLAKSCSSCSGDVLNVSSRTGVPGKNMGVSVSVGEVGEAGEGEPFSRSDDVLINLLSRLRAFLNQPW